MKGYLSSTALVLEDGALILRGEHCLDFKSFVAIDCFVACQTYHEVHTTRRADYAITASFISGPNVSCSFSLETSI
jgi:hypothetical protein